LLAALATLAGCASLLGFEDREFGDTAPVFDAGVALDTSTVDVFVEPVAKGGALRFSELGSEGWFEVRNVSNAAIDLKDYRVLVYRSAAPNFMGTDAGLDAGDAAFDAAQPALEYTLKNLSALPIAPGAYAIVRRAYNPELAGISSGPEYVSETDQALFMVSWRDANVALVDKQGVASDLLRFGNPGGDALSAEDWKDMSLPNPVPKSILARSLDSKDTNTAKDWAAVTFDTPAGPNDVNDCKVDEDKDGIPDCAEAQGRTFAGEDYFAYGARPSKLDLFVEFDQMKTTDSMNLLRREAIEITARMFATKNIAFHGDVGARFDPAPGINSAAHDLGGGNEVPFVQKTKFDDIYLAKASNMRLRRWNVFHYFLVAAEAFTGENGIAELGGNDGALYFGVYKILGFTPDDTGPFFANEHAMVLAHEFGHNLGLNHGGDEGMPFKPNYPSIMNYLWRSALPPVASEPLWFASENCGKPMPAENNPYTTPIAQFVMNFSEGKRANLNEAALTDGPIDYNCNAVNDSNYSFDVSKDGVIGTLRDFNDWGNLKPLFYDRHYPFPFAGSLAENATALMRSADASKALRAYSPLVWDRGYVVPETAR
jgi:hypothetical protein